MSPRCFDTPAVLVALGNVPAPAGAFVIDFRNFRIWRDGAIVWRPLQLRARGSVHFRVLALLLTALPRGILPQAELVDALWGDDPDGGPNYAIGYVAAIVSGPPGRLFRAATGLRIIGDYNGNFILRYVPPRP